jgi:hypothetical protein
MHRSEYSLEYDTRLRNASWVCEHLFQNEVINKRNNTSRGTSVFKYDESESELCNLI